MLENVFKFVSMEKYSKVKRMQRSGTEAIRTQIQPSKPKREITNITYSQNTKRTYGQPSERLFPKRWPFSNRNRIKTNMNTHKVNHRLRDGSLQTSSSRDDSSGTFRSKFRTGLFAPKKWDDSHQSKFTGRFTHFHNIHVYSLKIKFGDTVKLLEQ